ncbi:MAG: Maf family protein [Verrucomicrobia bacterium]|nr:Maf family protein [Verrucomicrobiota bacterium]
MSLPHLVLASASPRREALLRQCGVHFEVVPAGVPELEPEHLTLAELCLLNAHRKARAVAKRYPDRLVLGADTMVGLGGRRFGKPRDPGEARAMLTELSGRTHEVITGVCLLVLRDHQERLFAETTRVTFRALGEAEIRAYLAAVNPLDKAGAYAIQEQGDRLVADLEGSYANVVGLPVERVLEELRRWGEFR